MAISLVGVATADSGTGSSAAMTVTLPGTAAAGHFAVLWTDAATGVATVTGPTATGWTEQLNGPDAGNAKPGLWTKLLDASDISAGTVTATRSSAGVWSALVAVWSGVDHFDVLSAANATTTATTSPVIPAVTPGVANALRLGLVAARVATTATAATATAPAGWAEAGESIDSSGAANRRLSFIDSIQLAGQNGVAQTTATATTDQTVAYVAYSATLAPTTTVTAAASLAVTATLTAGGAVTAAPKIAGAALAIGVSLIATAAGASAPPPGTIIGTGRPRILAQVSPTGSTTTDPNSGAFIVGQNRAGDRVSSLTWVNLDDLDDLVSVTVEPGQTGRLDSPAPARCTVVVENYSGTWDTLNPGSRYAGGIEVGMPIRIRTLLPTISTGTPYPGAAVSPSAGLFPGAGSTGSEAAYGLFRGYVDEITPDYGMTPTVTFACTDQLAALGRAFITPKSAAFNGDTTGTRLGRILDEALVPASLRRLDDGVSHCVAAVYGDWALGLAQQVVQTEFGELWVDGDGRVVFYERTRLYVEDRSVTVQATFSDSGTDIDMDGLIGSRSRSELYNQATISRDGVADLTGEDAASKAAYGPQAFPAQVGTLLNSDVEAASLLGFVLAVFSKPRTQFSEINVDATPQGVWDQLLALRRFDRIRTQRTYRPGLTVDVELLIEGISHSITQDSWHMTISTRDVDTYRPFIVGVSKAGAHI